MKLRLILHDLTHADSSCHTIEGNKRSRNKIKSFKKQKYVVVLGMRKRYIVHLKLTYRSF